MSPPAPRAHSLAPLTTVFKPLTIIPTKCVITGHRMSTCIFRQSCALERVQAGTAFSLLAPQMPAIAPCSSPTSPLQLTQVRQAVTNQKSSASKQKFSAASRDGATGTDALCALDETPRWDILCSKYDKIMRAC